METLSDRKRRVTSIVRKLNNEYPKVRLALDFETPLDLLIALILPAQSTDAQVNQVTSILFRKYRSAKDWKELDRESLEQEIRSTRFYRNKPKTIQQCTKMLVERFGGEVPNQLNELIKLPGVGRKTANCLRGNVFGQPAIGVDTHVGRLAQRIGLSTERDPNKIELDLTKLVAKINQVKFCQLIQLHGRLICTSRKPKCETCVIQKDCPKVGI